MMAEAPSMDERLVRLSRLMPDDREAIHEVSADLRRTLEAVAIHEELDGTPLASSFDTPPAPSSSWSRR